MQHLFPMQAPAPFPAPERQAVTPTERWGAELQILLQVCNASIAAQLPEIWNPIMLLKKYRDRAAMEAACRRTADGLRFRPPRIPHAVAVMVMDLAFHTKDLDGVGDTLNIFLLLDLSLSARLEAVLLTRKWDAILGRGHLDFLRRHESAYGEAKGRPHRRLGRILIPTGGLGGIQYGFPWR